MGRHGEPKLSDKGIRRVERPVTVCKWSEEGFLPRVCLVSEPMQERGWRPSEARAHVGWVKSPYMGSLAHEIRAQTGKNGFHVSVWPRQSPSGLRKASPCWRDEVVIGNWWHRGNRKPDSLLSEEENKAMERERRPEWILWYGVEIKCFVVNSYFQYIDWYENQYIYAFMNAGMQGGSVVKNPPDKHETWVRSLGQEDPLEREMATQSSIFAWEIP